ncbi:MAG: AMP-binding protein [Bdellovibrionaceae bacterium]|nr:AMP-binding protein [Pseudobdellovibrionaceae bacterium]MDW8189499.1 AMP-binding protein [Pseudobdellovibrionaceae bacterium]
MEKVEKEKVENVENKENVENIENNVSILLEKHNKKIPNRVLFHWVERSTLQQWDFNQATPLVHQKMLLSEFVDLTQRLSYGLNQIGITKGDCVILFLPMDPWMYIAMASLQRLGAIPVFLDSWARRFHLAAAIEQVRPKAIISFPEALELVKEWINNSTIPIAITWKSDWREAPKLENLVGEGRQSIQAVSPNHTALITFTTGSSGVPKGADRTHRFLFSQHYALSRVIPYLDMDVDIPTFPIFSLNNIATGIPTVLPAIDVGVPKDTDPVVLIGQMKACQVTCMTLSPSLLNRLAQFAQSNNIRLDHLRRVVTGGAPITDHELEQFSNIAPNSEIWVLYGSTEVEPIAHIEWKELRSLRRPHKTKLGVNVGHIDKGLRFKFLKPHRGPISITNSRDWQLWEVAAGMPGELCVSGEHVCEGYYNNPTAFQKTKIKDIDGTIWHRTGDVGYLDENNYLWLVGRVHNAILRKGTYYFPVEPEGIIKRLPGIKKAAYLGISDPELNERAVVAISFSMPMTQDKQEDLFREIKEKLSLINYPVDDIFVLDKIPMDPRHHSKVEYDVLRKTIVDKINSHI